MRRRIHDWRRRKRRELFKESGAVEPTIRLWLWLVVLRPRQAAQYLHTRFQVWACLPGDVFEDFQMDCLYVVHRKCRDGIAATGVPRQALCTSDGAWMALAIREPEVYAKTWTDRWTVARTVEASRARELVAA